MKVSAWHIGRLMTLKECLTYISQENGGTAQHTGPPGFGQESEAGARGRPNTRASTGVSVGKVGRAAQDWLV